ncbi:hypothetical protein NBRC3257_1493 [Gluconobacter thailandicus NBRC 3257]|uniref:Uncharacterized protein n=1 Tax=Gluconobacter thailandicus NBRC 3257 TaxID=1381097 RepID=A0ABQ0IWB2_GLUTH|nr:hypothetical protein NBRC3257_1493 [Gluconobacter thailandicus NBRC 3257]
MDLADHFELLEDSVLIIILKNGRRTLTLPSRKKSGATSSIDNPHCIVRVENFLEWSLTD